MFIPIKTRHHLRLLVLPLRSLHHAGHRPGPVHELHEAALLGLPQRRTEFSMWLAVVEDDFADALQPVVGDPLQDLLHTVVGTHVGTEHQREIDRLGLVL